MRLDRNVKLGGQLSKLCQQVRRARDGETGCDDWGHQRLGIETLGVVDGVDVFNKGSCVGDGRLCGFRQEIGRILVHVDFPHVSSLTLFLNHFDKLFGRIEMDSREPAGGCCSIAEGTSHCFSVDAASIAGILELGLVWECQGVEPVKEGNVVSIPAVGVLWGVLLA